MTRVLGRDAGRVVLRAPDGGDVLTGGGARAFLLFDMNALCDLEAELEKRGKADSVFAWIGRIGDGEMSARDVRLLFWAGLQAMGDDIDEREAGRILRDAGGFAIIETVLREAIEAAMPAAGDAAPDAGTAPGN